MVFSHTVSPVVESKIAPFQSEIEFITNKLIRRFPDHRYVFIGRSPTIFSAYFELNGYKAEHLPVTSAPKIKTLSRRDKAIVEQYVIERLSISDERPIVFIDYVNSGDTVFALDEVFALLKKKKKLPQYSYFLLLEPGLNRGLKRELYEKLTRDYQLRSLSGGLSGLIRNNAYNLYAPYKAFRVKSSLLRGEKPIPNQYYISFKEAMAKLYGLQAPPLSCFGVITLSKL